MTERITTFHWLRYRSTREWIVGERDDHSRWSLLGDEQSYDQASIEVTFEIHDEIKPPG